MAEYAADQYGEIAQNLSRIRREEGRPNLDLRTATGLDLDSVASGYGIERRPYEVDTALRERVLMTITQGKPA